MKKIRRALLLGILLISIMTVGGAYATWAYAENPPNSVQTDADFGVEFFAYAPEEILPDEEEDNEIGENHLDLIQKILHEVSYGLNATKKPIIHNLLNKVGDVVCCEQTVQGGNLKHLMIDGTYAYALLFQIEYVSETEYVTYTYVGETIDAVALGDRIQAYRTVMRRDDKGVWSAPASYHGTAEVRLIRSSIRGLDSSTWLNTK